MGRSRAGHRHQSTACRSDRRGQLCVWLADESRWLFHHHDRSAGALSHRRAATGSQRRAQIRRQSISNQPNWQALFRESQRHVPARENSRSPIEFNIELKRAVMARGRIVNIATGEAVQAGIYYSPFLTNELLRPYVQFHDGTRRLMGNDTPYHTDKDGWFEIPVAPGRGVIAIQCDNRAFRTSYGPGIFRNIRTAVISTNRPRELSCLRCSIR